MVTTTFVFMIHQNFLDEKQSVKEMLNYKGFSFFINLLLRLLGRLIQNN